MQKPLFLLLSLILFCPKSQSQDTSPRLIKKEHILVFYDSVGIEEIVSKYFYFFDYDELGNLIEDEFLWLFEPNDQVYSHTGNKNEYNGLGNIVRQSVRHYNSDVDLWINDSFFDYFYDDDNCLIKKVSSSNIAVSNTERHWTYTNDDQCRKVAVEVNTIFPSDTALRQKNIYEYTDGKISFDKKEYFLNHSQDEYNSIVDETNYNDNEDIVYVLEYQVDHEMNNFDTLWWAESFFQYTFDHHDNGFLKSKKTEIFRRSINPASSDSTLNLRYQSDIEYDCRGNPIKEIIQDESILFDKEYVTYFYEGKNNCFDNKENLTMRIFPNPTNGIVNISSSLFGSGDTNVRVFDIYGRMIFEEFIESRFLEQSFDLGKSNLATGNYIIQLMSDEYQINEKLIFIE